MKPTDRDDLSRFLVHLTRDYDSATAETNLVEILRSQRIEARNAHCLFQHKFVSFRFSTTLRKKFHTVCLTEVPFTQLKHLAAEIPGRQIELQPYGIVFRKSDLLDRGASPALYINAKGTVLRDYLLRQFEHHFRTTRQYAQLKKDFPGDADSIINYYSLINVISDRHDFSWEREWRYPDDLRFDFNEIFALIASHPRGFLRRCRRELPARVSAMVERIPIVSPDWNAERILDELSIRLWNGLTDDAAPPAVHG